MIIGRTAINEANTHVGYGDNNDTERNLKEIFLGTARTSYTCPRHFRVQCYYFSFPSYWFCVIVGVAIALSSPFISILHFQGFDLYVDEKNYGLTLGENKYVEAFLITTFLLGLCTKQPSFLLPFRIACGLYRFSCLLLGALLAVIAICLTAFVFWRITFQGGTYLNIVEAWCGFVKGTATNLGEYMLYGPITAAATKCSIELGMRRKSTILIT